MKGNKVKNNNLERKDYNLARNYKEWKPEEFEYEEIICSSCGIYSSDDSWKSGERWLWIKDLKWFQCSQCDNLHCSRCVVDAEFENDMVWDERDPDKDGSGIKHVKPFIDKGKVCFPCLDSLVDTVDLWRILHKNNVLIKDEKVLEQEEDNNKWYNF